MSRYHIEVEINEEASGYEDRYSWVCYGTIVAMGDSLKECLEGASVDLVDQDGGTVRDDVEADQDWMQDAVEKAFMAKYPPPDWREHQRELNAELRQVVNDCNGRGR